MLKVAILVFICNCCSIHAPCSWWLFGQEPAGKVLHAHPISEGNVTTAEDSQTRTIPSVSAR